MKRNRIIDGNTLDICPLKHGNLIIVDGGEVRTKDTFYDTIDQRFAFPTASNGNPDTFMDWIRDLSWMDDAPIYFVIFNKEKFLCDDLKLREIIIDRFKNTILPYWENGVVEDTVDGQPREFTMYLANSIIDEMAVV